MNGILVFYRDQYGDGIWARTARELRAKAGGGRLFKIYADKTAGVHAGKTVHCGYGVGRRWFTAFAPIERAVS